MDICIKNLGGGWKAKQVGFGAYEYEHIKTGASLRRCVCLHDDESDPSSWYLYGSGTPELITSADEANQKVNK